MNNPAFRARRRGRTTGLILGLCLLWQLAPATAGTGFGLDRVVEKAKKLAAEPHRPPPKAPAAADIDRTTWSSIDFRNDAALWHDEGLPFEVQFFHLGSFYQSPVKLHVIDDQGVAPVGFAEDGFVYPEPGMAERLPDDLGYAGFRLHHPLGDDPGRPEFAVFLGASYFRAVGEGQVYGLSGRGAAIDTALDSGEEFPEFREFWLEKPGPDDGHIRIYALMDSPSLTGAYEFVLRPGEATVMDVKSRLFIRKPVNKLGLAPLTSMFMFGESSLTASRDWRTEMHDSDGLLMVDGTGEWLWRPLVNPQHMAVNSFTAENPQGFGLIQQDRAFDHYHDLRDKYERRPSAWVTPEGDWGKGHVELIQIPSGTEQTDNMVAFWVPAEPVEAGQSLSHDYRIRWSLDRPLPPAGAHVTNTLVGEVPVHEQQPDHARRLGVDFVGGPLASLAEDAPVETRITVTNGELLTSTVRHNPHTGGKRLAFDVLPDKPGQVVELRAYLADAEGQPLTETWSYALNQ